MRRSRPLGRKENTRAPKITFYIYCEGENTEPGYIDALRAAHPEWLVELEPIRGPGAPANLVRSAKSKLEEIRRKSTKTKQSFEGQDQVWALFDDDARKTIPDALDQARVHGVGIGYSNPCFELWLILHQCDFDKVLPHKAVQKHFEKICPEYQRWGAWMMRFAERNGLKLLARKTATLSKTRPPPSTTLSKRCVRPTPNFAASDPLSTTLAIP